LAVRNKQKGKAQKRIGRSEEIDMNQPKHRRRDIFQDDSGFSLTELLVVISIVVIISAFALLNIGSAKKQLGRQNVARELKSAFERARFDSVKRRTLSANRANVVIAANSFTLNTDVDQNGTIESGEARVNNAWMSDVSICDTNGTPLSANVTVFFDNRGEISTTGGPAEFLVCNGSCSTPSVSNSNLILVTKTGTVNILSGGSTVPTFSTPTVTTISNSANINPDVTLN
jgi:prepilin-type N-terminal cleavage/methylation domain-containing protein